MDNVTFEGKTSQPVYPTTVMVTYTAGFNANVDAASTWKNGTTNSVTPASLDTEVLNENPTKVTLNASNQSIDLAAGTWRITLEVEGEESGGATSIVPRVAIVGTEATPTVYEVFDMGVGSVSFFSPDSKADVILEGTARLENPAEIRMIVAKDTAAGTWSIYSVRATFKRMCDYVVA